MKFAGMKRRSPIRRLRRYLKNVIGNTPYLVATSAPFAVVAHYWRDCFFADAEADKYQAEKADFLRRVSTGSYSNDWFTRHIPCWLACFRRHGLAGRAVQVLEVGSWEGLSANFILQALPDCHLTCVDTWQGSDEHGDGAVLNVIERHFDDNIRPFLDRVTKFKGTSFDFFNRQERTAAFDLVYIDASHYGDDVMIDALGGFERLKAGGLMIFDDYLWKYYESLEANPAMAINLFLRLKRGQYEVERVYDQLIIKKTSETDARRR